MKKNERLIARMILGFGLSVSIASITGCGISHAKLHNIQPQYDNALLNKDAYLDSYEQTDEFKALYNADFTALNNRLVTREINGHAYDKELEKLNNNEYTEKVLIENADDQTKANFDKVNQKYLTLREKRRQIQIPSICCAYGSITLPVYTGFLYYLACNPEKKRKKKVLGSIPNVPRAVDACIIKPEESKRNIELKFEFDETSDSINIITSEPKENQNTL